MLKLIALNGAKRHLQSIYLCILCLCSSSFLPRQLRIWAKLHDTVRCYVGPTKKRMVSSVWRRKYCLRNLEYFCGRALSNCRNKFHAPDPTPGAYSRRRRAESVPAPLLACVEPGRESTGTASSAGLPKVVTVPCSSCPPPGVTKGAACGRQCHVWVVRVSAVSWQDGSVIIPEEMGGKEGSSSKGHSQM